MHPFTCWGHGVFGGALFAAICTGSLTDRHQFTLVAESTEKTDPIPLNHGYKSARRRDVQHRGPHALTLAV